MSNGRDDLVQLRKLVPKQASENVICQKEWSWRRKLKRQMRCLPMISCPPRLSLTRCGTGWARPSTASAVASLTLLPFFSFLTQSRPWCVLLSARNGVEQRRSRILLRRSPAHRHRMRHGSRRERKCNPVPAASRSPENLMASRQEYKLAVESVWLCRCGVPLELQEILAHCDGYGLRAVGGADLLTDGSDMLAYAFRTEPELLRDVAVSEAPDH